MSERETRKINKNKVMIRQNKGKERRQKLTRRQNSRTRKKKKHKLDVKGPLKHGHFFIFGLYFGENETLFFPSARQDQINGATCAHLLFFKGSCKEWKKGRKELEEGACVSPCAVSSAAEKTHRSGKRSVEGKRRLHRLQPHKGSHRLNVWELTDSM